MGVFFYYMDFKIIELTQGKQVIVDDSDYQVFKSQYWQILTSKGGHLYARTKIKGKTFLMHRLIMNTPEGMETDHINGNGLDNRRSNLRIVTKQENLFNQRLYKNNTSGFKGVTQDSRTKRWKAQIQVNGMRKGVGYFKTALQAAMAYDIWAKDLYGEHAKLNFA